MTRLAIIITTYNWPEALESVLQGLARQTVQADEIWVADDGSTSQTAETIERLANRTGLTIHHVWQEDKGFRAAAIRNRALNYIKSDYVVMIDGDCVPQPDFVAMHKALAEPGYCVVGNRILLSQSATPRWLSGETAWPQSWMEWLKAHYSGDINRCAPLIRLPVQGQASAWRRACKQSWKGAKTCNLAMWRRDLLAVNGLDESYAGWGLEDSDLMIRVLRQGIRRKNGRFATGVIHLWHRENDRAALPENQKRLEAILKSEVVVAQKGIQQIEASDHHITHYGA